MAYKGTINCGLWMLYKSIDGFQYKQIFSPMRVTACKIYANDDSIFIVYEPVMEERAVYIDHELTIPLYFDSIDVRVSSLAAYLPEESISKILASFAKTDGWYDSVISTLWNTSLLNISAQSLCDVDAIKINDNDVRVIVTYRIDPVTGEFMYFTGLKLRYGSKVTLPLHRIPKYEMRNTRIIDKYIDRSNYRNPDYINPKNPNYYY